MPKASRERRTLEAMTEMFCAARHRNGPKDAAGLCPFCAETLAYARERASSCRYGSKKPVCSRCTTHCYRADMRDRIREMMRYAGPRMLFRHPVLAAAHGLHALSGTPPARG